MDTEARYLRVLNRNTTHPKGYLHPDMLFYMGASTNRKLTGQGVGFKFTVSCALGLGMEAARASNDADGRYIANFFAEPKMLGGELPSKVVCATVIRENGTEEVISTTQLVEMADNAWSESPLGEDYPLVREPVLDAADEDAKFTLDFVDEIEFAPVGHTATYLSLTETVHDAADDFDYYFKKTSGVKWLDGRVGVMASSSTDEYRLFLTAEGSSLAYVAYSSGDDDPLNDPAYDYVLVETDSDKLASVPKRLVESPDKVNDLIRKAWLNCKEAGLLAKVFSSVRNNGFEARMHWPIGEWQWRGGLEVVREAFVAAFGSYPIEDKEPTIATMTAKQRGIRYSIVGEAMFKVGRMAGMPTLLAHLGMQEIDAYGTPRHLTKAERADVLKAVKMLEKRFGGGDWKRGHLLMGFDSKKAGGFHAGEHEGRDVIGLNMEEAKGKTFSDEEHIGRLAEVLFHELAHHIENSTTLKEDNWHGSAYIEAQTRLAIGTA